MCSDAFPAGLTLTLRKGVGRSFMPKGDGKDGYKRADKEKTGTDIWELAGRLVGCVPSVPLREGAAQDVAGLVLPHVAPPVQANRSLEYNGA